MKLILVFILSICSINCVNKKENNDQQIIINKENCLTDSDKKEILNQILSNEDVYKQLNTNVLGRLPIKILSNKYFNNEIELKFKGERILFVENYDKFKDVLVVKLIKIDCNNNKIDFGFFSKIEGADILGFVKKDSLKKWGVSITQVGYH